MDARTGRIRSTLPRALATAVGLGAVLAAGACSAPVNPGTPENAAPHSLASPSAVLAALDGGLEPDDAVTSPPPFPASLDPAAAEPSSGASLTVTDVRVTPQDGFDRVVYELAGSGMPGWTVGYVSQAVQDGSGMVLALEGRAVLWVSISGSGYPSDTGETPFSHPTSVRGDGASVVTEVQGWTAFEGTTGSFIGVADRDLPFRVYLLEYPLRVVVDVAQPPL